MMKKNDDKIEEFEIMINPADIQKLVRSELKKVKQKAQKEKLPKNKGNALGAREHPLKINKKTNLTYGGSPLNPINYKRKNPVSLRVDSGVSFGIPQMDLNYIGKKLRGKK
jgi:hypothetical protein